MRIAVNTRLLLSGKLEGIGWFTHEALSRITRQHPEHRFIFLFDRPYDAAFVYAPNVEPVVFGPPTRHPLLYRLWFQYRVPRMLRRHRADLFLSPDGILSLRTSVPQIAVVHDLNFEAYPKDLPPAYSRFYRRWFPRFARKAARLITVSEFSKADIAHRYGIDPARIDVAWNGVGEGFRPLNEEERQAVRDRLSQGRPYFVCVGAMHPRKNLARALEAFDRVADGDAEIRLVLVGERMFRDPVMERTLAALRHRERVHFTGRLERAALREAVGGALALVFASYYEGFGIPVAEAMKCGVPVVAARATSLPEVAGEAAVYVDPFDVASIAAGMDRVRTDAGLRAELAAAGIARAQRYTWQHTADAVLRTIQHVLADR